MLKTAGMLRTIAVMPSSFVNGMLADRGTVGMVSEDVPSIDQPQVRASRAQSSYVSWVGSKSSSP